MTVESNFAAIQQAAMDAFETIHQEQGAPEDYTFEDFEHDLIVDLVAQVDENEAANLHDCNAIESYSLLITSALRNMRDGAAGRTDGSDEVMALLLSYIKKQAH